MINYLKITYILFLISLSYLSISQDSLIIDEIIVIVGDQIVLKSDVERQKAELRFTDSRSRHEATCELLKQNIYQKLLLNQAYIDSIEVTSEQVNDQIDRRLEFFVKQIGSKEALEKYYEKTIPEIKDEMKDPIKEMLLIGKMKDEVMSGFQISPRDVRKFFNSLPPDSLPYYNTEVELAQILIYPEPNDEEILKAKQKIEELRNRIVNGEKLENLAILYSEDGGSSNEGGDLGMRAKSEFVTEFSAAAMKLKKDSISKIIETKYGYHILQLVDRKGERIHVKHILIQPKITYKSRDKTKNILLDIIYKIKYDTLTFVKAALIYSEDENTRNNGGLIFDAETGSSKIPVDKIDASLFFIMDTMEVGQISSPTRTISIDGREAYRILFLKSKTKPHKANLKEDYPKIMELAESHKRIEILQKWVDETIKETFITIHQPYDNCDELKQFIKRK